MKCQSLFSGKNKKNINLSFAELAPSMVSIKYHFYFPKVQYNELDLFFIKTEKKRQICHDDFPSKAWLLCVLITIYTINIWTHVLANSVDGGDCS